MDFTREGNQVIKNNILAVLTLSAAGALLGCAEPPPGESPENAADSPVDDVAEPAAESDVPARDPRLAVFESLPELMDPVTLAKVNLGRKLFYDRRLSLNDTISCAMCHVPDQGFTVNEVATAVGMEGRSVRRNAPTLYNVAYFGKLFHDARENSLEQQVWMPLLNARCLFG